LDDQLNAALVAVALIEHARARTEILAKRVFGGWYTEFARAKDRATPELFVQWSREKWRAQVHRNQDKACAARV
jgi:hypothetical protein